MNKKNQIQIIRNNNNNIRINKFKFNRNKIPKIKKMKNLKMKLINKMKQLKYNNNKNNKLFKTNQISPKINHQKIIKINISFINYAESHLISQMIY